ncbi:unnamed protein product [Rotaria sp. Silwood1]|nr:unnamed protein product [Rotaria sp. Silwood1]CAF1558437.1 unnamed protein product [Rotaria sp. Silwood1]CAF3816056.1 unnamed protein product [Rotaria sp. Silwood1]CAF4708374.1 unnamed protein product [Rotaria sp. Silwood1]
MSKIITVSLEDEEHVVTVDPGEDIVDMLTNMLGNVHNYTFTVNGKKITSVNDLSKELHHNTKVEVKPNLSRAAFATLGPRGFPLEIISRKNPTRPTIKIETVHISCSSDSYDENENMAGLIVYSFDNKQMFELNGHRCRTGYILIKATKNIEHVISNQGIVHGSLFKWFYGIEPDDRFVGAGFSLHDKNFKFNSGVFNARNDDYHDDKKSMSESEIYLIKYAMNELFKNNAWKMNPTLSMLNIGRSLYNPGDCLPIQNYPKSMINSDTH